MKKTKFILSLSCFMITAYGVWSKQDYNEYNNTIGNNYFIGRNEIDFIYSKFLEKETVEEKYWFLSENPYRIDILDLLINNMNQAISDRDSYKNKYLETQNNNFLKILKNSNLENQKTIALLRDENNELKEKQEQLEEEYKKRENKIKSDCRQLENILKKNK